MTGNGRSGSGRGWLLGALPVAAAAIFLQVLAASHSAPLAFAVTAAFAGLLYGLVVFTRRQAADQLEAIETTGRFAIDAGLDFECLPDNWPTMARETLNPAGADRVPSLPVRLSVGDGILLIEKKQSWGSGRRPFAAEVRLADITEVAVGRARRTYAGSSLRIRLRTDEEVRVDLPLAVEQAETLADRLRQRIPRLTGGDPSATGIVVKAPPPPLRTSPARAGLLLMAAFPPFVLAMAGALNGAAAAAGTLVVLLYALWLQMRRPPTMHRRLALVLALASVAFVVDTLATGDAWRLTGTIACLALAASFLRLAPPSY